MTMLANFFRRMAEVNRTRGQGAWGAGANRQTKRQTGCDASLRTRLAASDRVPLGVQVAV